MGLAMTTLRVGLGGVMAGHGLQKLAGKFGGHGLDATAAGFEQMGMKPGKPYATAAALSETIGGGLLAAGLFTPLGAAMVTGTMTVAIGKVHGKNGLWVTNGGMEYNLTLMAAAFAITEHGAGFPAIDGLITKSRKGFGWALMELAAGVGGGLAVMALSDRTSQALPAVADKISDVASAVSDKADSLATSVSETADAVSEQADSAASAAATGDTDGTASPEETAEKLTSTPTTNS